MRGRPDALDEGIINHVRRSPNGATIPDINRTVCPGRTENLVRYRTETLAAAGLLHVERMFGRVIVTLAAEDRHAQERIVDV